MLTPAEQEHFDARGFVRVRAAFTATEAEAMRDVVWRALERDGIQRDDRTTWTVEAPSHLQDLKAAQAFRAIASARTDAAIDALLGSGNWRMPKDWGAFFVLFPTDRPWTVPTGTWHLDHPYTAPLTPLRGLKVHAMFGDVEPRAGGMTIIAGSHRVVARFFSDHPPPPGARASKLRQTLMASHPYLRDLCTEGDREARIARFTECEEEVFGVPVRVVELTATAAT
jgi:hypothetical protein